MQRVFLGLARLTISAWVGAAVLFVVTGVREVRAPELNSYVRDVLVTVRFPAFYVFGFALVGTAFCTTLMAGVVLAQKRRRLFCLAGLLFVALAAMVGDYIWVYQPLVEMVTPPGQSRPAEFVTYHKASKWLNALAISLCGIAAMFLCGQKAND